MRRITFLIFLTVALMSYGQNNLTAIIKDAATHEPLTGATGAIQNSTLGASADLNGKLTIRNIPNGQRIIRFNLVGYIAQLDTIAFPRSTKDTAYIYLKPESKDLDVVVVTATRSSRHIDDIPTRVETIATGELAEKNTMQPANIKMILTESTGIQTQQTSATSANASIRIQGLDGKYTQLLKDGFPLYSGYSGGLSLVQVPPLDLRRVEVIKGAASTLYGGGAIAGLINFVTKEPTDKKELTFLANANMTNATDFSGFYAQKFDKVGVTVTASQNNQAAYDVNKDGLSDIPKQSRFNINPRLFYYIDPTSTISLGLNAGYEYRLGGDMQVVNHQADASHTYFERNITNRYSTQLKYDKKFANNNQLTVKNSVGYFDRSIARRDNYFAGKQISTFSEADYLIPGDKSEWVFGGNLWTDKFNQSNAAIYPLDENLVTVGAFAQNSLKVSNKFILETGLRTDITNQNDKFVLPRISALYKITNKLSSRLGGGLGYKSPTIFSEESEERGFRNIQPLNWQKVRPERSIGANWDINYHTVLGEELRFALNQMFFYTRVNSPLILSATPLANGNYEFHNASGYLDSKGFETNAKFDLDDLSLYLGYTYIDARRNYDQTQMVNPLTAKHRLYSTLMYEVEDKLRVGYELFYTGRQYLSEGASRPDYWIMGISAEWMFKHFSLFVNAENFTDTRQSRFESMYTGTIQNPQFRELWAPTDGFVFNGGFKIKIW